MASQTFKEKAIIRRRRRIEYNLCHRCGCELPNTDKRTCGKCLVGRLDEYRKRRYRVLRHYGGKCACCGEDRIPFLALDHMKGAPRLAAQKPDLAKWLEDNGLPENFRVLCHNCNFAVRYGRICPHKVTSEEEINALYRLPPE